MVNLITGPKGTGKTQQMIELANEKVKTSNGNVVFIKKSHRNTTTLDQFFIMGLAGFFAVKGYITIGSIVAVTQLTGQVISPAFELSAKISELKSAKS